MFFIKYCGPPKFAKNHCHRRHLVYYCQLGIVPTTRPYAPTNELTIMANYTQRKKYFIISDMVFGISFLNVDFFDIHVKIYILLKCSVKLCQFIFFRFCRLSMES